MGLTPEEIEVAYRAAKRYGLSQPSFMDVIDELTPSYANMTAGSTTNTPCTDKPTIQRWHRVCAFAMTLIHTEAVIPVEKTRCRNCDTELDRQNARYCDRRCQTEYRRAGLPICEVPDCGQHVKRVRNKTCSPECARKMGRIKRPSTRPAIRTCEICDEELAAWDNFFCSMACAAVKRRRDMQQHLFAARVHGYNYDG
jgi:hypothetical protein